MNQKTWWSSLFLAFFLSITANASIAPQMINLNLHFKTTESSIKSDLSIPLYQTAEIEKRLGKKNYLISFNPRQGKNSDEINIEIKFLRPSNSKVLFKKQIVAKLNRQSIISAKGMMLSMTPVI